MNFAAYLDAFETERKNAKTMKNNGGPFGAPPAAGGIPKGNQGGFFPCSKSPSSSKETQQAFSDLHADQKNVAAMSGEELVNTIHSTLKSFSVNKEISDELKAIPLGELPKKQTLLEISNVFIQQTARTFAKAALLSVAIDSGLFLKDELVGMASTLMK
ncbi:unnamed protein product [Oikopleura dioica]|uniref:Uncharacterized protein n=1 Tax=Oikopleura dioica TaxID=34765 RepID=E4XZ65_OIKDI|nr:unnamed protein product [Oikopleura dioica]